MKSHIIRENIEPRTPEWYAYRLNYVNASEVQFIMEYSHYVSPARIFLEKIGRMEQWKDDNKHTYWGRKLEDSIAEAWQYYEPGSDESYIQNAGIDKIVRKSRKINGYIRNPKYPHLSCSPDRVMEIGSFKIGVEGVTTQPCPIEIKTIKIEELDKWVHGIPLGYLAQLFVQMLILEADYGELVLLDDKRTLHVFPVPFNEEYGNAVIEATKEFHDKVVAAKELIAQKEAAADLDEQEKIEAKIQGLEPPPDGTKDYENLLKEKYRTGYVRPEMQGSEMDYQNAVTHIKLGAQIKELEEQEQLYRNMVLKSMEGVDRLSFGAMGYVSYSADKNGKRSFRNKVKLV